MASPIAQKKAQDFMKSPELALFKEMFDINQKLDKVMPVLEMLQGMDLSQLEQVKGDVGETGPPGMSIQGERGERGETGYTPVKGVDYFDGKPGKPGRDGRDGKDGKDAGTKVIERIVEEKIKIPTLAEIVAEVKNKLAFKDIKGSSEVLRIAKQPKKLDMSDLRWHGGGGSSSGGGFLYQEVPAGTKNGINTIFTLSSVPTGILLLTQGGVLLTPGVGYTRVGLTVTFTSAPLTNEDIYAIF
jgi:hypothetical protein